MSKDILRSLALPLFALAAVIGFYSVWLLLKLPPQEEILRIAKIYFDNYGLITVFVCAILEAVLFAWWYFPGSLVIVLAVVFAGHDLPQIVGVWAATTAGFLVAYPFNYFVGKYGWYRLLAYLGFAEPIHNAQRQLLRYGPRAIFLTYWHPNLGALTATAAGILRLPFRTFMLYTLIATILWDIFWTIIGVSFGQMSIALIGPKFVLPFIAIWIVAILLRQMGFTPRNLLKQW